MTEKTPRTLPDLTADWPAEPGNDDLARLGNDLFAGRAQLPQIALDRVQVRMRQAMQRRARGRAWRRWGIALLLCVAALVVALQLIGPGRGPTGAPDALVREKFTVDTPPASTAPPDKPVIDVDSYKDLFGGSSTPGKSQ